MKLSRRLEAIASFIDSNDKVCDVGCDHGYLDIYLALNRRNKTIIATDISEKVIQTTKENLKKYKVENKIKVYCTNGTQNINDKYDTLVISGLGAHTIIDIINNSPKVAKIIISSNNNWETVRRYMTKFGYSINEEKLIEENKKIYSVILFQKNYKRLSYKEIIVGKYNSNNKHIYQKLINKNKLLLKSIPYKNFKKRFKIIYTNYILKKYLSEKDRIITS